MPAPAPAPRSFPEPPPAHSHVQIPRSLLPLLSPLLHPVPQFVPKIQFLAQGHPATIGQGAQGHGNFGISRQVPLHDNHPPVLLRRPTPLRCPQPRPHHRYRAGGGEQERPGRPRGVEDAANRRRRWGRGKRPGLSRGRWGRRCKPGPSRSQETKLVAGRDVGALCEGALC